MTDLQSLVPKLHIYVRVSTIAQEAASSIETQHELGMAQAKALGCEYQVWNEGGQSSSGDDLSNRPILIETQTNFKRSLRM